MESEKISAGYMKQLAVVQTVAETRIKCPIDTQAVMSISASAAVRVSEVLTGEVRLAGRETFELVLLTASGLESASGWIDFTDRTEVAELTSSIKAFTTSKVLDTDVVSVSGGEITLASVVESTIYMIASAPLPLAVPAAEGVYTGEEQIAMSRLVANVSGKCEVKSAESLHLSRIITADARASTLSAEGALDAVQVLGEVVVEVLGDREGSTVSQSLTLQFEEEVSATGARRGDKVISYITSVRIMHEENENGITLSAVVEFSACVYAELSASHAVDAFSPTHELELGFERVTGISVDEVRYTTLQVDGSISLVEGQNADRVLSCQGFSLYPVSAFSDSGRVVVEGAVTGNVIFADAEAESISSERIELPFRITTDIPSVDGTIVQVYGNVGRVSVKPSSLGELSARASLCLCLVLSRPESASILTTIKRGNARERQSGIISLHVAPKDESLWECAKALSVSPETITLQNPDLAFPIRKGERVVIMS